ncbi:uncharacterized protein N7459_000027 [Penicillium hispanicum]|uniref:uncharacterized protein n=1 Tax=Penicillium hispanicum TaxID=1080232 RepID=UPI00254133F0|nr:uncharacterized protein N7459_000027 [Penicillium hispanicum]KAJ5593819.1 hypothetical protein N7459_000027 [Penicillium hispanicum]
MLGPIELSLFPSCFGGIDWSPDGELAVAAGEQVHILTPKTDHRINSELPNKEAWNITRIRVNVFTNAEWAMIYPQTRDDFSIAAEQSISTVLGLAWSPSGLARFRRSVLAVLTSNLILSLWEPVGAKGQWARVGIVNHAFHPNPAAPKSLTGTDLRRANIRSFQWCSPLHAPTYTATPSASVDPESRWGVQLLVVANDENEVALLQVRRLVGLQASTQAYYVEKLALLLIEPTKSQFPETCPGSLLQSALQHKARITSISCGPWLDLDISSERGVYSAVAVIATVYGTQLQFLKATVALSESDTNRQVIPRYEASSELKKHNLPSAADAWNQHRITGPLQWFYMDQTSDISLAIGVIGGLATMSIPRSIYNGSVKATNELKTQNWPTSSLADNEGSEPPERHLEPISGLSGVASLDQLGTNDGFKSPRWRKVVADLREQFDLDRDLGGEVVARIWGLASYRGITAVLFTRHPTDMIEYQVTSGERAVIGFASEETDQRLDVRSLFEPTVRQDQNSTRVQRQAVISYLLSGDKENLENDMENQKLIYSAACCALVDGQSESVRNQARQALERLAAMTGADLSDELANFSNESPTIPAKSNGQFAQPGAHLFEWCEICDAGIEWFSAKEAQCANGHLFSRCGLSFITIQEPGLSKYCSGCGTECFDEDLMSRMRDGRLGRLFAKTFEAFDTCIYCGCKFQGGV